jgi:3-deoxy-D-manno-octulosonic-acid transferase
MNSKVENLFNLTNYRDLPENKDYLVFFFYNFDQGYYFQHLLNQNAVDYEMFIEEEEKPIMMFGVRKRHFKQVLALSDLSYARFKKPFIANMWIRYAILGFTVTVVLIAIIGYFLSSK